MLINSSIFRYFQIYVELFGLCICPGSNERIIISRPQISIEKLLYNYYEKK